jgi:hypothetical protein
MRIIFLRLDDSNGSRVTVLAELENSWIRTAIENESGSPGYVETKMPRVSDRPTADIELSPAST